MTTARSLHGIAAVLRAVADQLDQDEDTEIPDTYVDVSLQVFERAGTEAERVAAVDAIAAAVGTEPHTDDEDGRESHHKSRPYSAGHPVLAYTAIFGD